MGLPAYLDRVPDYVCEGGRVYVTLDDFTLVMSVPTFLAGCERGKKAIVAWQKAERARSAKVIPIKKRRGH